MTEEYRRGYRDGWRMALGDILAVFQRESILRERGRHAKKEKQGAAAEIQEPGGAAGEDRKILQGLRGAAAD